MARDRDIFSYEEFFVETALQKTEELRCLPGWHSLLNI